MFIINYYSKNRTNIVIYPLFSKSLAYKPRATASKFSV